jgi:disease resistance protein RPM1
MDLVTGALGKLPSKLLKLLSDEYKLQTGVKDQIRRLTRELESMHAALRKLAQVPPDELDELVLLWARDVREASYDMEDIIDTFLIRVDGDPKEPPDAKKVKRFVKRMSNLFSLSKGKARHKIAGAIDALSKQLEEVALLRGRYTVDDIVPKPAAKTSIDPRLSSLYTKVSELVGIHDQRDKLIQMLTEGDHDMQPNRERKIVCVAGVGGLGKTTLVKAVYDKLTIDIHFNAFVPVGQNPDLKKILRDILIDLDKQHYTTVLNLKILDERQLINELRKFLRDKRYYTSPTT